MTQKLSIYQFGKDNQRVEVIRDKEWWCVSDACKILDLINVTEATRPIPTVHLRNSEVDIIDKRGWNTKRHMLFVDEYGINQLIMFSRKPQARAYKEWAFGTVLPSIRKTGSYSMNPALSELQILKSAIGILEKHEQRLNAIEAQLSQPKQLPPARPVVEFGNRAAINRVIRDYGRIHQASAQDYCYYYQQLYSEFYYRYHIDLSARARNSSKRRLDIAGELGVLDKLYDLAVHIFSKEAQQCTKTH